jgi:hypothetical protein
MQVRGVGVMPILRADRRKSGRAGAAEGAV